MKIMAYVYWTEMKKSHYLSFHSTMVYFSLLIWPIIMFFSAYFSYKPFNVNSGYLSSFINQGQIGEFLLIGYLGYIFYFCLIQSAFQMAHERERGTLEIIFLSPVSRMNLVYGRALGNLLEGVWLFFSFVVFGTFFMEDLNFSNWIGLLFSLLLLVISSVIWGGFLNALLLFSRDSGILYDILQEPLLIFSSVRIPHGMLPIWGQILGLFFPLTFVLNIFRQVVMEGQSLESIKLQFLLLLVVLSIYVFLTKWIILKAEKNALKNGSFVLF